jgi:hypothetical protein
MRLNPSSLFPCLAALIALSAPGARAQEACEPILRKIMSRFGPAESWSVQPPTRRELKDGVVRHSNASSGASSLYFNVRDPSVEGEVSRLVVDGRDENGGDCFGVMLVARLGSRCEVVELDKQYGMLRQRPRSCDRVETPGGGLVTVGAGYCAVLKEAESSTAATINGIPTYIIREFRKGIHGRTCEEFGDVL